jgi:hypothetical protein
VEDFWRVELPEDDADEENDSVVVVVVVVVGWSCRPLLL